MNPIAGTALKWGFFIGLANLIWLYLAYYLGLHTNGIMIFQIFMLVWLLINVAGYLMMLKSARQQADSWNYLRGMGAGIVAGLVSALLAVAAQIGYWKVVHPEWPQYMVEQTQVHYEALGLSDEEVHEKVEQAKTAFTLPNYAIQSATAALGLGIILTALMMLFLRRKPA